MQIVGLTGSIAMGKSHTARIFKKFGVPVFDSDAAVHRLFEYQNPLPSAIATEFGDVLDGFGNVDRKRLGAIVLGNEARLEKLESLVHPAVFQAQRSFLKAASRQGFARVVLDIPLLFESARLHRFDATLVVACSSALQRQRVMRRPGMTLEKFDAISKKQMPIAEKCKRADRIIASGFDRGETHRQVASALSWLDARPADAWPQHWS